MNILDLKDKIATVTLTEAETKPLFVMSQYWIETLPDDDPGTQQLRELACRFDIH
jgi:hypothetical protein